MNAPTSPESAEAAKAATAGQEPGFVLAGEPPVLEAMAATQAATTAPDASSSAAPAKRIVPKAMPAPKPPSAAAAGAGPSASSPLEQLAAATLDAADLANRGAQAASRVSADLREAQETLRKTQESAHKQALILMISASVVMVICMAFFLVVGIRMNSRINQLDLTIDAVVKRVVDMNTGVESLDAMKGSVGTLAKEVESLAKATGEISAKLEASVKQTESLTAQIPGKTAQQVASSAQGVSRQVEALSTRLQAQSTAVQTLAREVQSLRGSVGNVDKLNRDVQSLVTLQRERYLETVQRNPPPAPAGAATSAPARAAPSPQLPGTAAGSRAVERASDREGAADRSVQYPRPQQPASPNAAGASLNPRPAASSGLIVVAPKPQP